MTDITRYPLDDLDIDIDPDQDAIDTYLDIAEYTDIVDNAVARALGYSTNDPKWEKFARSGGERFYLATENIMDSYEGFFVEGGDFVVNPDGLDAWVFHEGDQAHQFIEEHWNDPLKS